MTERTRPTIAQTRAVLMLLKSAQADLDAFIDPDNTLCGVPAEVRREAERHFYLSTWVKGPLVQAIGRLEAALEGRPYHEA